MNREDISRMAREAGFVGFDGDNGSLRRFASIVAAAEREACAKACEGLSGRGYEFDMGRLHSAVAIRARGETK